MFRTVVSLYLALFTALGIVAQEESAIPYADESTMTIECLGEGDMPMPEAPNFAGKSGTNFAPNGRYHTPRGNLHVLVVYINYTNADLLSNEPTWVQNQWPDVTGGAPPLYALPAGNNAINDLFTENPADIPTQTVKNLSSFYYQYSNPSDRFLMSGQVYPQSVPVSYSAGNWSGMHRDALDWIAVNDPNFPWADFDRRTNMGYASDNTNSSPDGMLDYVVFIHRAAGGSGIASSYVYNYAIPGTNYKGGVGHMFLRHGFGKSGFWNGFLHEFAHVNQSSPHYAGANNTHGYKYYVHAMWGLMQFGGLSFRAPSAWESWWRGWLTPEEITPANVNAAGLYLLRDFATEHKALKIKIPFSDRDSSSSNHQYLWIENHQKWGDFDRKDQWINNCWGSPMDKGLYMYVVDGSGSDRCQPSSMNANLIRPISCRGNVDYVYTGQDVQCNNAGDYRKLFTRTPNSVGGINDRIFIPYNTDPEANPPVYDNRIDLRQFTGNSNVRPYNFVTPTAEAGSNPQVQWWWTGAPGQAFAQFTEASFSAGIPIHNTPTYDHSIQEKFEAIYFNGLSIKISLIHPDGTAEVYVSYNDHHVSGQHRWTHPNMVLPDLDANTTSDKFEIKTGAEITMNASGTPNRNTVHPVTGTWVTPAMMTIESGGNLHLESNSDFIMEDGSKTVVQNGGVLEVSNGAEVLVRDVSSLELQSGGTLLVHDGGRVIIDGSGTLQYHPGAVIQLDGQNAVLEIRGNLRIENNADFTFTDANGTTANSGHILFAYAQSGTNFYNISVGVNTRITLVGSGPNDLVARVAHNAYVFPLPYYNLFTIENGFVEMGEDAFINIIGGGYRLHRAEVDAIDVNRPHDGIRLNGQANQYLRHVTIRNGIHGISANQTLNDQAVLVGDFLEITDCTTGLQVTGAGVVLTAADLLQNNIGYRQLAGTANSRIQSCDISLNGFQGVEYTANGGGLHISGSEIDDNGYRGVFFQGNGRLTGLCSSISRNGMQYVPNGAGVVAGWQATVAFDDALEAAGSQMTILDNPTAIRLGFAADLYLDMGRNDLVTNPENIGRGVYGTLAKTCSTLTLAAERNHWNRRTLCPGKAPAVNVDYQLNGLGSCTISLSDPVRHCPAPCAISNGGNNGGGFGNINSPLQVCKCSVLTTSTFEGLSLNEAYLSVRDLQHDDPLMRSQQQALLFAEILTTDLPEPTTEEQYILDLTRHGMMSALMEVNVLALDDPAGVDESAFAVLEALAAVENRGGDELTGRVVALERTAVYQALGDLESARTAEKAYQAEFDEEAEARLVIRSVLDLAYQVETGELDSWQMEEALRDLLPIGTVPKD